jgi:rieske iron-sulfur protein
MSCRRGKPSLIDRRFLLKLGLGISASALSPAVLRAQSEPAAMAPQVGDVLVKEGDRSVKALTLADIPAVAPFVSAWPADPANKLVRSANRLNQLLLIKMDPKTLSPETLALAADGVLAYSALCTHAGCNVNDWIPEKGILSCDCHASDFDARSGGKVVDGPASRALPLLALKSEGGVLVVASTFPVTIRFDE